MPTDRSNSSTPCSPRAGTGRWSCISKRVWRERPAETVAAARDTATNPAVIDAFALAIIAGEGPPAFPGLPGHEPDLAEARQNAARIAQAMAELRKAAPGAGSYVAESGYFEEKWQSSYWGDNYPRLLSIKNKYDPAGLFFVRHGVGTEGWSDDGFVRTS